MKHQYKVVAGAGMLAVALSGCSGATQGLSSMPSAGANSTAAALPAKPSTTAATRGADLITNLRSTANWPQGYYNAGHTGFNPKESTLSAGNVAGLTLIGGMGSCPPGGFAIDKGTIYVRQNQDGCDQAGTIRAYDASTYVLKWSTSAGGGVDGSPDNVAVAGNVIVTPCSNASSGGLCGYSARTGERLWYQSAGYAVNPDFVYANGTIYAKLEGGYNDANTGIYALNPKTGAIIWSDIVHKSAVSCCVADGAYVYYVSGGGFSNVGMTALNASTGAEVWASSFNGLNYTDNYAAAKGVLVVTSPSGPPGNTPQTVAFDDKTGAVLWSNVNDVGCQVPAIAKGVAYVALCQPAYQLAAFSLQSGKVRWRSIEDCCHGGDNTAPAIGNGVIYTETGTGSGFVTLARRTSNGKVIWTSSNVGGTVRSYLQDEVVNGVLYSPRAATYNLCVYGLSGQKVRLTQVRYR